MSRSALLCAVLSLSIAPARQELAERYSERSLRGWSVHVERTLEHDAQGAAALELLDHQLYAIERAVPAKALEQLRRVPIWLSKEDAVAPCMCYHPSAEWLASHGFEARKAKSVEIANAANFLTWTHEQPSMVLHELAHAYHDQVLGYGNSQLHEAFEGAKAAGRYDEVLHWDGQRTRHYALTNDTEFFAEMTEAYFGTNDFHPFVRAELLDVDAETVKMLRGVWGT